MIEFIESQIILAQLYLNGNELSAATTERLLNSLTCSASVTKLKVLGLTKSANLSTNEACNALADLIGAAK